MRKHRLFFGLIIFISLFSCIFFACKDKDKITPLIFLIGNDTTAELEKRYVDLGAIAEDNADGNINSSILTGHNIPMKFAHGDSVTSRADPTTPYEVHYYVTDKAGNATTKTRKVLVRNWAWPYEAQYTLTRTKVSGNDSIGYQYGDYPLKTPMKVNITADKDTNKRITLPIGGSIKVKVFASFTSVPSDLSHLHLKIGQQEVIGVKGIVGIDEQKPTKYRVFGFGSQNDSTIVKDSVSGRKRILIKYYIQEFDSTPSVMNWKPSKVYCDMLNQRY
ncbi:MAG: hypothetical protein HY958_07460 [Bacteroidia bacterium]|nr:hypothetical protein [Bacteroidia bacterium]